MSSRSKSVPDITMNVVTKKHSNSSRNSAAKALKLTEDLQVMFYMYKKQFLQDYSESFASELLENIEEMFPRYW